MNPRSSVDRAEAVRPTLIARAAGDRRSSREPREIAARSPQVRGDGKGRWMRAARAPRRATSPRRCRGFRTGVIPNRGDTCSLMDSQRYRARLPRSGKVMRRPLQHQSTRRRCWVHRTSIASRFVRGRSRSASDPGQSVTPRMQRGGSRKCNSFNHRWPPRQHCSSPARQVTTAARRAGHLPPTLTHDALRLSWARLGSSPVEKDRI